MKTIKGFGDIPVGNVRRLADIWQDIRYSKDAATYIVLYSPSTSQLDSGVFERMLLRLLSDVRPSEHPATQVSFRAEVVATQRLDMTVGEIRDFTVPLYSGLVLAQIVDAGEAVASLSPDEEASAIVRVIYHMLTQTGRITRSKTKKYNGNYHTLPYNVVTRTLRQLGFFKGLSDRSVSGRLTKALRPYAGKMHSGGGHIKLKEDTSLEDLSLLPATASRSKPKHVVDFPLLCHGLDCVLKAFGFDVRGTPADYLKSGRQ